MTCVSASTYATLGSSAGQYNIRSTLWPAEWNTVVCGGDIAAQSSSVMSQCRQPSAADIIQSGREPYADMLGVHGAGATQTAAEFGDLASMFTGFIE